MATLAVVQEADFRYLLHVTELTKGNLSAHLSKLEEAGYVEIEKTFRGKYPLTICRLTEKGREAFEAYRQHMVAFLQNAQMTSSESGLTLQEARQEALDWLERLGLAE